MMRNKMLLSFVAVLIGIVSLSRVQANTSDYTPVPKDENTYVAYIEHIDQINGKIHIEADYIDWYEGEEADKIFREREQDPDMMEAPDGYYIVNDDTRLEKLELASDALVLMQLYNRTGKIEEADIVWNEQITVERFISLFAEEEQMDMRAFPYHLTVADGVITQIVQQYVP